MNTQVIHTSYTKKAGYVWRKRYAKDTLSIALQTQEPAEATRRSASLTIRFMQLETMAVPFTVMRDALKAYRDELLKGEKLALLQAMVRNATGSAESDSNAVPEYQPTQSEKVAQIAIQRELEQVEGHSLEEAKKAFFDANTEWKQKTIKDYSSCIDRFILWAAANQITNIEAITKDNIIQFKAYMDEAGLAPLTKQKILTRMGSMFSFTVDVKEWLPKNPVTGMMYKKVAVQKPKEEITPEQFEAAVSHASVQNDYQTKWAMNLMYYTGMRISELCQLTKADYIEIEGIKCVSINTHEEGKSTKTETSKRNIPLCNALLEMGVWEEKPVLKTGVNRNMDAVSKAFNRINLKRSTHCFRHSISNRLRDTGCEDSTRYFILGHAQATITDRVYVTRLPLMKMKAALNEANQ